MDTTAAVENDLDRRCLELVAADDGVDAVIGVICPTAVSVPTPALSGDAAGKPLVGVVLDQQESVVMRDGGVPRYRVAG